MEFRPENLEIEKGQVLVNLYRESGNKKVPEL